jgi:uncharacterized protein YigE (DUF2233 family)
MTRAQSFFLLVIFSLLAFTAKEYRHEEKIISYTVDPKEKSIALYWKDDAGNIVGSLQNLKTFVESKKQKLLFAANGGMYMEDFKPLGLFIQDQKTVQPLNTRTGSGNFYLKPNGVFYLTTDSLAVICTTENFAASEKIKYATQSGPMLVIDGQIHPSFREGSANLNIRNGVGVLPDNKVIFAMSKTEINLYDFADYFKSMGCTNALYLDGFVSRTYLPVKNWIQTDGNFGVIIGVTEAAGK